LRPDTPHILLVNPWIHDFAAYDVWAKPSGLLQIASILRDHGYTVSYVDCLNRFHERAPKSNPYARHGRGPYLKKRINKPAGFKDIPRYFSRYGIKKEWLKEDLLSIKRPDLILVTTMMTYWYPGTVETIKFLKEFYQDIPVVLGGIYPTLCKDHAVANSGADIVISGAGEQKILELAGQISGFHKKQEFNPEDMDTLPYPAYDLQTLITYIPIMTSRGCPFSCSYCASSFLNNKFTQRNPNRVTDEVLYWHKKYNVRDFILYDDAFLVNPEHHAIPILTNLINAKTNIRFHTPNALHIREITKEVATLMFHAGFTTIRLGLETASFKRGDRFDKKVTYTEFMRAVSCLKDAGFKKKMIGAYILAGLPNQSIESIKESLEYVNQCGITPIMAYYTPIPHTAMWEDACAVSRYDLTSDPIFTNNAAFPCWKDSFSWEMLSLLKKVGKG